MGKELVKQLIRDHDPHGIRVFSRGELEQWKMRPVVDKWRKDFNRQTPVAFLVGDVRDADRLRRAMEGVDVVIHAAALKQIGSCEDNPLEAVQTNIHGSENVLNAALDCCVEKVMYTNTDKSCQPTTLYGATKMVAERLFIDGNVYSGSRNTRFSACRYGNVLGSRGSVAHVFREQARAGLPITITSKSMTRFWTTIANIATFTLARIGDMRGGEVFVPKMKSLGIYQMACAMAGKPQDGSIAPEFIVTGIRQGEKLHESLFSAEEYICEYVDHYVIWPRRNPDVQMGQGQGRWELRSDRNPNGELTRDELLSMLEETGI